MLTKAFIKELPKTSNNLFKVEVPIMEDNTATEALFDALLCGDPSNYNGYNVGDAVYVSFEDEKYDKAVILGKLYVKTPSITSSYSVLNELKVTGTAELPFSTTFGDNYSVKDFINLYNSTLNSGSISDDDLKEYVKWVNTKIEDSEETKDIYANKIRVMTGELYGDLISSYEELSDKEKKEIDETLYFLTTPSPTESDVIEGE